jgi:aconitate hydratase
MTPSRELRGAFGTHRIVDLAAATGGEARLARMPWCHRVLLENILRQSNPATRTAGRDALLEWLDTAHSQAEIPFAPSRILMHDTTCGPALVDIAAMRDALAEAGGDPGLLNPVVSVASSVDHSVAVDIAGSPDALAHNMARDIERNTERYRFMKWAASTLRGFRVFPPGTGIMHTINLERLSTVVSTEERDGVLWAVPDTLVGTDSHTPMVNAIGVLGWGVGGIEAEGVMFGVPVSLRVPDVVGVRLVGALADGVFATDLALVVTERLRKAGVSGEFVEFFGPGVGTLSASERAVVANMAPEYGASTGCFAIDARTLEYLRATGRTESHVALIEAYAHANGLWHEPDAAPRYTRRLEIDLSSVAICVAGPRRPQDRLEPAAVPEALRHALGASPSRAVCPDTVPPDAVAIAAITSCTNTTDTGLLVAAGLVARNARRHGLHPPAWVKTSLTPGSPASAARLARAHVIEDLEAVGFSIAGYGCATCIGNSGPLLPILSDAIERGQAKPVAVLSGNRNFPGRVHTQIDSALLASPPLVVAYAIAGRAMLDITRDRIGTMADGTPVHLSDLWPRRDEIDAALAQAADPGDVAAAAAEAEATGPWASIEAPAGARFPWNPESTYLRRPPFVKFGARPGASWPIRAHPLLVLGDDITTDHISPAGAIPATSDAGTWLIERGEDPRELNVYAARRGNFEVLLRGLFTNRTVVNRLCPNAPPGSTIFAPTGELLSVWRAAAQYEEAGLPVVIIAGERYGTGSSRDWAAKGAHMLGVRAVLAASFERIHRSNLIGMGVLPLQLPESWAASRFAVEPKDVFEIDFDAHNLAPRASVRVTHRRAGAGEPVVISATALLDTEQEIALIRAGGMIPMILAQALAASHERQSRTRRESVAHDDPTGRRP